MKTKVIFILSFSALSWASLLLLAAAVSMSSVAQVVHSYPDDDSLAKGKVLTIPPEFRNGTASLDDVHAWAHSLQYCRKILEDLRIPLIPGHKPALFVITGCWGQGGSTYLAFEQNGNTFHFLGLLNFLHCRPVSPDKQGCPRLVTSWHEGGGETGVALVVLQPDGFHNVAVTTIRSGRLHRALFGTPQVKNATLRRIFGKAGSD